MTSTPHIEKPDNRINQAPNPHHRAKEQGVERHPMTMGSHIFQQLLHQDENTIRVDVFREVRLLWMTEDRFLCIPELKLKKMKMEKRLCFRLNVLQLEMERI